MELDTIFWFGIMILLLPLFFLLAVLQVKLDDRLEERRTHREVRL